jgi:hypothetical protein
MSAPSPFVPLALYKDSEIHHLYDFSVQPFVDGHDAPLRPVCGLRSSTAGDPITPDQPTRVCVRCEAGLKRILARGHEVRPPRDDDEFRFSSSLPLAESWSGRWAASMWRHENPDEWAAALNKPRPDSRAEVDPYDSRSDFADEDDWYARLEAVLAKIESLVTSVEAVVRRLGAE